MTVTIDKIGNGFMRRAGPQQRAAADRDRQPHRHPAHRRQVRRQLRRAGRARGGAHAERPRHRDRGADRGGVLDQRGRLALRAGDDGLGRVRQGLHARARLRREGHRRQDGEGRARAHRLRRRPRSPASTRSAATSRPTSSRARCWRTTTRPSASSPACSGMRWYDCVVTGMEAHAGPTPMALRKDALQVATQLMQEVVAMRAPPPAARPRHGGHGAGVPEQPQRDPGQREVQHRPAQRERRAVRRDGRRHPRRAPRRLAPRAGLPIDDRAGLVLPGHARSTPTASTRCARATQKLGYSPHERRLGRRPRRRLHGAAGARRA